MVRIRGAVIALGIISAAMAGGGRLSSGGERDLSMARVDDALRVLFQVPSGKAILEQAAKHFQVKGSAGLLQVFQWGPVSRTDAVLTRHYDPRTHEETRERKITVILKRDQPLDDLVLDVAHELTHASADPAWDPYDPSLTAARYIHSTIEGKGGEVDAVIAECRVNLELSVTFGTSADRCKRYRKGRVEVDRGKVLKDFYRVGKWRRQIAGRLGSDVAMFPFLSADTPQLYSSTGNAPYPVALEREYKELTRIACENSRKRAGAMKGRSPASESTSDFPAASSAKASEDPVARFLAGRCGG